MVFIGFAAVSGCAAPKASQKQARPPQSLDVAFSRYMHENNRIGPNGEICHDVQKREKGRVDTRICVSRDTLSIQGKY